MKRSRNVVALLVGVMLGLGYNAAVAQEVSAADQAAASVKAAEAAVTSAHEAIVKGSELVELIPEDSPLVPKVAEMLKAAQANWKTAKEALSGASESAKKIASASSDALAGDYVALTKANAGLAISGANVVEIAVAYVDAVANGKTESLEVIEKAMEDALAASSMVQTSYDQVKKLISEKYSK